MLRFGPMSFTLAFGALQGLVVAVLLLCAKRNRTANALLAGLLVVVTLRLVPYIAGYAGAYDAYPWLSFAPYNLGLAFGPLVYLYVVRITTGALPQRALAHFVPVAFEATYYCVIFAQPLALKDLWNSVVQEPYAAPLERWAILVSAAIYTGLAARRYRAYRRELAATVSFGADIDTAWIGRFLAGTAVVIAVWIGFAVADIVVRLSYFAEFPLYVVFALFAYALGLEGRRHATQVYPVPVRDAPISPPDAPEVADAAAAARGIAWLAEIRERELFRDPDLTLATLARELATNTTYLSRALNADVGENFNACINRLRVAAVCDALRENPKTDDLLALAFAAGFRSKASFNRAFKAYAEMTPSAYRTSQITATAET